MGSKKYPKENELDDYLARHGGYSNAWTDYEAVNILFFMGFFLTVYIYVVIRQKQFSDCHYAQL